MLARRKVKVALTGQGADEPWAGYDRHRGARFSTAYAGLPHVFTAGFIRPLVERFSKSEKLRRAVVSLNEPDVLSRFVKIYSFYTEDMKQQLFRPWLLEQVSANGVAAKRALRSLHAEVASLDPLTQILYLDTRTNLPDDLLMVGDKTSMAHSLETRVPLLDYRIVEFVESLPPEMRLHGLCAKYDRTLGEPPILQSGVHPPARGGSRRRRTELHAADIPSHLLRTLAPEIPQLAIRRSFN